MGISNNAQDAENSYMTDRATNDKNKNLYQPNCELIVINKNQQDQAFAAKNTSHCIHGKSLSCTYNTMHDTKNAGDNATATIVKEDNNVRRAVSFGKISSRENSFDNGTDTVVESGKIG